MRGFSLAGEFSLHLQPHPLTMDARFRLGTADGEEYRPNRLIAPVLLGAILVFPGLLAFGSGVLNYGLGWPILYDILMPSPAFDLMAAASLFLGAPLAVVLNLWPVAWLGLERKGQEWSASLTFRPTYLHLVILAVGLVLVAGFFGHLVADGLACFRGVKSAC